MPYILYIQGNETQSKELKMKQISTHAAAAKAMRKELKAEYPGIKFRIRADTHAGGTSVDVGWTDGPTSESVSAIVDKYQYGSFDGMIDLYSNTNERTDIPQVKFVLVQRIMSEATEAKIIDWFRNNFVGLEDFDGTGYCEAHRSPADQMIYREFAKTPYGIDAEFKFWLKMHDIKCADPELRKAAFEQFKSLSADKRAELTDAVRFHHPHQTS